MVLGLFEGHIVVLTDRASYSRGDTINCSCTLRLKESVDARGLRVLFQRIEGSGKQTRFIELCRKDLGTGRVYRDGERFEFTLPVDANAAPDLLKFSGLTSALQTLLGTPPIRWEIRVFLDMPAKLDVFGSVYPMISRPIVPK